MYDYGWYLMRFGLPPQVVDGMPAWIEVRLPGFAEDWDQVMSERRRG